MSEESPTKQEPRERPLITIAKLKEAIKDLPDEMPVYICCEGFDTEARLIEICEERVSTTGHALDPRRLVIDEDE